MATWPNLHVSQHPAVRHKLGILRDEKTEPKKFREVVRELSWLLGYEALADARMQALDVKTPIETMAGEELADRIGLIPILRAGLGMVDAMLELMPTAQVWHLGLFRDERTLRPVEYYNKLPDSATVDLCLILDPMLATGGSATAAIEVLKRWGAVRIKLVNLIAAPEGVEAVLTAHPDIEIHVAALDRQLNDKGYIMPGLGDAGDRQFGTGNAADGRPAAAVVIELRSRDEIEAMRPAGRFVAAGAHRARRADPGRRQRAGARPDRAFDDPRAAARRAATSTTTPRSARCRSARCCASRSTTRSSTGCRTTAAPGR